jgi:hypothetical protein
MAVKKPNWKKVRVVAAMVLFYGAHAGLAQGQNTKAKSPEVQAQVHSVEDNDSAYCKQFMDKDGGYKDKKGGYYNPKAGTYTDEAGGVVDNWRGYTYKSGSYKSKFGDYYDAKENVFKTTDGQTVKGDPGMTPAQAIQVMREDVEQRGGYDKDFTRKSMMQQIKIEHPKANGNIPPKVN